MYQNKKRTQKPILNKILANILKKTPQYKSLTRRWAIFYIRSQESNSSNIIGAKIAPTN
jgi:hypothetical protein